MKKLFILFIIATAYIFGTTPAFALRYAKVVVNSSPTEGGYVAASTGTPSLGTKTNDEAKNNNTKISDYTFNFGIIAGAKSGYVFKGWSMSSADNSGDTSNPKTVGVKATSSNNTAFSYATATYYAIFARMIVDGANSRTISCNVGQSVTEDIVVKHVHAGTVTASVSGQYYSITSSTTASSTSSEVTTTFTVKYKPTTPGKHVGTLTISSNNGLANQVVTLNGTGIPELVFDNNIATSYYVEDDAIDLSSLFTCNGDGDKTYSIVSFSPEVGVPTVGATAPVISDNKMLSLSQAGTLIVKLAHENGDVVPNGEKTVTIDIVRRPNSVTITFNDVTYANNTFTMPYGAGVRVLVRTANEAEANTITIAQTAGADLATYYDDQQAVYTSYKSGTATWSVSQPENYKYEAASATFTVNIAPAADKTCVLLNNPAEIKLETTITSFTGEQSAALAVNSGKSSVLYFDAKGNSSNNFYVQYSEDGGKDWKDLFSPENVSSSYKSYSHDIPESATHIRFNAKTGATGTKYIKNVKVLSSIYLSTSITSAEGLNMECQLGKSDTATFNINWSRPSSSNSIHIESSDAHFTLSQSVIEHVGCNNGVTQISVVYTPTVKGEDKATITIYDESQVITLKVNGTVIDKRNPEINWLIPAIVKPDTSFVGLGNILTTTNNECALSITSSDASIATYDAATQTLQTYDKEGFVTFTVAQSENSNYHAAELQFTIFVTDKENEMCVLASETQLHKLNVYNTAGSSEGKFSVSFDAPASVVKFYAFKEGAATDAIDVVWYDGSKHKLGTYTISVNKLTTSRKEFVVALPREARSISFDADGTLFKYVDQVCVYRAQYLEHDATLTDGALNFGSDEYGAEPTVREFNINYSGAGSLKVFSSNSELFSVTAVDETIDCEHAYGSKHITVSYAHSQVGSQKADITVQLETTVLSIPVVGTTNRPSEAIFIGSVDDDWKDPNNWLGGVTPADNADITVRGKLVIDGGENRVIESLTIEPTGSVLVVDNGSLTVNHGGTTANGEYGPLYVDQKGNLTINDQIHVSDFYLAASLNTMNNASKSGQVFNPEYLDIKGDAYFTLDLDPSGACSYGWYAFTVPFPVDVMTGISRLEDTDYRQLTNNVHYAIMEYDEATRATGSRAWRYITTTLQPGVLYLITTDDDHNTYRFRKSGAFNTSDTKALTCSSSDPANAGWNGIGNGTLTHASVAADDINKAQVFNHATNGYDVIDINASTAFAVGSAFFVQAPANENATYTQTVNNMLRVAARDLENDNREFMLTIASDEQDEASDRLYLSASENALPSYEIGHDLVKMGASTSVAQLWSSAYGQQLCDIELPLASDMATFPLSLYAPKSGDYTIAIEREVENETLYLTYNGAIVWNLSYSDYTTQLPAGTTDNYGIMLIRRAQQITTDMDAINANNGSDKFIINGNLYILRDGAVYDVQGRLVK